MLIDITRLKSGILEYIDINQVLDSKNIDLSNTSIISLKDISISGTISKESDFYYIDIQVNGVMVLPCSITLKPVDYSFSTQISGNIEQMLEEINETYKKTENTIDIFPIIWENILMEIPIKVTSPDIEDIQLSGDGWKLVTDEVEVNENNAFDKLKDLL